jgi:hypothetical protein
MPTCSAKPFPAMPENDLHPRNKFMIDDDEFPIVHFFIIFENKFC